MVRDWAIEVHSSRGGENWQLAAQGSWISGDRPQIRRGNVPDGVLDTFVNAFESDLIPDDGESGQWDIASPNGRSYRVCFFKLDSPTPS